VDSEVLFYLVSENSEPIISESKNYEIKNYRED